MNYEFEDIRFFIAERLRKELALNSSLKGIDVIDYVRQKSSDSPNRIRVRVTSFSVEEKIHNYMVGRFYSPYGYLESKQYSNSSILLFMVDPKYATSATPLPNGLFKLTVLSRNNTNNTSVVKRELFEIILHEITDSSVPYVYPETDVLTKSILIYQGTNYIAPSLYTVANDKVTFDPSVVASSAGPIFIHYFRLNTTQNFTVKDFEMRVDILPYMYLKFGTVLVNDVITFRVTSNAQLAYDYYTAWETAKIELKLECQDEMARDKIMTVLRRFMKQLKYEIVTYNMVVDNITGSFADGEMFGQTVFPMNDGTISFDLFYQIDEFKPLKVTFFTFTDISVSVIFGEPAIVSQVPGLYYEYFG